MSAKVTFNSNRPQYLACECIFSLLGLTCDVLCFASLNREKKNYLEDYEENKHCAVRFSVTIYFLL